MHGSIGQNIKSFAVFGVRCPVSGVCEQDCDIIYLIYRPKNWEF